MIRVKKGNQVLKKKKQICQFGKTGLSGFGRIKDILSEEDDCSTLSSDDNNDTDDEYNEQELLVEFNKLISKHMKL
jgi:hypothetical protein